MNLIFYMPFKVIQNVACVGRHIDNQCLGALKINMGKDKCIQVHAACQEADLSSTILYSEPYITS